MSKRQTKHNTTPRPNWQLFRSKNLRNVDNKSEETCSKNPVHLDKVKDAKGRIKDPYSFSSDTSWNTEGNDACTDSSWTSLGSDTDSDDDIQFIDSVFVTKKTEESEILELSSPETMRFRDRDDDIQLRDSVFSSTEIEEYDFGNPKLASTRNEDSGSDVTFKNVIPATKARKNKFGNPKLASTRNEGNDMDVLFEESTINKTITKKYDFGNPKLESTGIEEYGFGNPKFASTGIEGSGNDVIFLESVASSTKTRVPVGIDYINNFIKTPPLEDFDYKVKEEVMEVNEESLIPISLKTLVKEEDKGHISKFSEGKESPETQWSSFQRYDLKSENFEDLHITTVNTSDIVDEVFKTSNDSSRFKMNVAVLQKTAIEESQNEKWNEYKMNSERLRHLSENRTCSDIQFGKNKRRRRVKAKNASVAENQNSNSKQKKRRYQNWRKRPATLKSASVSENPDSNINQKRRRRPNRRKKNKTGPNMAKYEENVEDRRTAETPLSRSTAHFADNKVSVNIKEEEKSKPKIIRRRKHSRRTQKNKEEWNEYKKYLASLPICDFSIKKNFSDTAWGENEKNRKSKANNKRCRKKTKSSMEKWNEHEKYLGSLPICDLKIKKSLSDNEWGDSKSWIIPCLSIKKELD